ncbi:hypothetical protein FIA58_017115 [Flavobacterium jejuense]|uniref:DUF4476 domain-containing protein n=1 Tax=Flavobacterium jejuense TaxID=1544455 RepID=A0ABX0IXY0_9FLAO|nr:hypothetical protein [Flavobacterium jejuense]NHN27403.1 hypothetical protein [Flavobacterium jejuense]
MKKKLEAELISIAHRVLKLKNRSETKQLQEEARKLYEQLTVLRFYEENFEVLKEEISKEEIEAKLENPTPQIEGEVEKKTVEVEQIDEKVQQIAPVTEKIEEERILKEDDIKEQPALFDGVLIDDYKDVSFVKVEEVPKEVEKVTEVSFEKVTTVTEPVIEIEEDFEKPTEQIVEKNQPQEVQPKQIEPSKSEIIEEEPRTMSLNDKLTRGISFGLNDRIAFEKKLFGGSAQDLNRVLSQLNTFDSFEEARSFINEFVRPDYNNWDGKEEYETRFLEIIERKFN